MKTTPGENHKALPAGLLKRAGVALAITLLLLALTSLMRATPTGASLEVGAFAFLQRQLSPFESRERLPILVVDISKIPGGKDQPTPRDALKPLIESIAAQRPKAIAVDINFSPSSDEGWKTDDDPEFFDFCLKVSEQVPVLLGVQETSNAPSDTWLGLRKYKGLAAAVVANKEDSLRMPRWLQPEGAPDRLPTMGQALAERYEPSPPAPGWFLSRLVEGGDGRHHGAGATQGGTKISEALVNYSKLEQIQHETLATVSPASVREAGERFRGRMVLLGDATQYTDPFVVPGRNKAVAGVYLIACAAYTLAVQPVYELNAGSRIAADLLAAAAVFCVMEWGRRRTVRKRPGSRYHRLERRVKWLAVLAVTVGSVLMVTWLNILWLDFLFVIPGLLLHPVIDKKLSRLLKNLRHNAPSHAEE